jgi:hypothetical protein
LESKSSRDLRRKGAISIHNTGFAALHQAFNRRETRKQKPKDEKQKERKPWSNSKAIGSIAPQLKAGQKNGGLSENVAFCLFSNIRSPV